MVVAHRGVSFLYSENTLELNTLFLVLAFHISLGLSARKTAFALNNIFALKLSYQRSLKLHGGSRLLSASFQPG